MFLHDDLVVMNLEKDLDTLTEANYARSIRYFGEWLGRPASRKDLVEATINAWLKSFDGDRSKSTIKGHKSSITRLWNWLAEQNHVPFYNQRRLRRVRIEYGPPRPWSLENVRALLKGAECLQGRLRNGISASQLMTAWVLIGYESGLRPKDIRLMRRTCLDGCLIQIRTEQNQEAAQF